MASKIGIVLTSKQLIDKNSVFKNRPVDSCRINCFFKQAISFINHPIICKNIFRQLEFMTYYATHVSVICKLENQALL